MVSHFLCILLVGFLVYIAQPGSSLFSWHPTLMSVAFGLLLFQGVLSFNRQSSLFAGNRERQTTAHALLNWAALGASLTGGYFVWRSKEEKGRPHLTSWHSWIGALCNIYLLLQCIGGVCTRLKLGGVRPADMKLYHATSGTFMFTCACAALASGMWSDWFSKQVTGTAWYACFVSAFMLGSIVCKQVCDHYLPKLTAQQGRAEAASGKPSGRPARAKKEK
ncbi:hypothetical protein BOX15_Mlig022383g1 [Macrostomum lignano]|uniref:ascorbate ferrireductase (transmembrane) n=1 Tax=Macrostomum lignano TaxID=282301 RepID=A0A267G9T7_9PLAT|nr:hypothetical protein BOX15_Mlig022383g1 [Macrostomum lignano]